MIGMNVKKGILCLPILLVALLMVPAVASAQEKDYVPITGTAFGQKLGLLHFDYRTAAPQLALNSTNVLYVGPTKQYYNPEIIPGGAGGKNSGFPIDASEDMTAKISTAEGDCTAQSCKLRGFIWSDTVGWIVLDGTKIADAMKPLDTGINEDMDLAKKAVDPTFDPVVHFDDVVRDPYLSDMYPRISKVGSKASPLIGLAWNRHAGWIRLSSNYNLGTSTPAKDQTVDDWGAWLDTSLDPDTAGTGLGNVVEIGRRFHGNIWSEKLGWIKLGSETGDEVAFQAFTKWVPDNSAPLTLTPDKVWFSVGVNTGYGPNEDPVNSPYYNANPSLVIWKGFTMDPQSNINTVQSKFNLVSEDPACTDKPDTLNKLTMRNSNGISMYDLSVPNLGIVPVNDKGYCTYTLSAKIYNGSNMITYIGSDYLTNPVPKANSVKKDAITVFVRAGNVDISAGKTTVVSAPNSTTPAVLGDGKETFGYTVQLMDINNNPIQSIDCSALYAGCPKREVKITASIDNDLLFDLTKGTPSVDHMTPLMSFYALGSTTPKYLTSMAEDKVLDVAWDAALKIHSLYFSSAAPNVTYSRMTKSLENLKFLVNGFDYAIRNIDELPATSKRLDNPADPDNSALSDDPATVVPAYDIDSLFTAMPANSLFPVPLFVLGANPGKIVKGDPTGFVWPQQIAGIDTVRFNPPVMTGSAPQLASGGIQNVLTVGLHADLKTSVANLSTNAIYAGSGNTGGLAIDNIITYVSKSTDPVVIAKVALMQTQRITQLEDADLNLSWTPVADEDQNLSWTDPIEGQARYELFDDSGKCYQAKESCVIPDPDYCVAEATCDAMNSPFHSYYASGHTGKDFCYDVTDTPPDTCAAPNFIASTDGTYAVTGEFEIPSTVGKGADGKWLPGKIDRNDVVSFKLDATGGTAPSKDFAFRFTPEKIVTDSINDIQMKLYQDIAYRYPGQILYSVFTAEPKTNFDVKDIGLEAKGTVVGEQLTTGRNFDTIGSSSTRKLQEQVRRNVAQLTSGLNQRFTDNCVFTGTRMLASLDLEDLKLEFPNCVIEDSVSKTAFAYFEGGKDSVLELGDGTSSNLDAPKWPFTLILKGGANLYLRNNIRYSEEDAYKTSSLGFILIAAKIGEGANVYVSPAPTNLVGSLYAEGSLIGCSDTGSGSCASPARQYYGGGTADLQELKNQLFWQGSIASRNTIAGAGIKKKPDGISCITPGDTELSCAQRYDLDYLRRFTSVVTEYVAEDLTAIPPQPEQLATSAIMNNGRFSGGGCCGTEDGCTAGAAGLCKLPDPLVLPTTVVLDGGGQIVEADSELSTFYIEPSKRAAFTPPGFSLTTGQESTQTIR